MNYILPTWFLTKDAFSHFTHCHWPSDTQSASAAVSVDHRWHHHVRESLSRMVASVSLIQQHGTADHPHRMLAHQEFRPQVGWMAVLDRHGHTPSFPEGSTSAIWQFPLKRQLGLFCLWCGCDMTTY